MNSFASRVIAFNRSLRFTKKLPQGIRIMNPFKESKEALKVSEAFYNRYYGDNLKRRLILGINPGRFGAGLTGIPFTDPKRLVSVCGLNYNGKSAHEPSSEFVYDMIAAFGGPDLFYSRYYINSICPLGFTSVKSNGKEVNYNYYDNKELQESVSSFVISNLKKQIALGVEPDVCYCLGTGKNAAYLKKLNERLGLFERIEPLEHPRYVMQYKSKEKREYIDKYLRVLSGDGIRV
jgi:hypothetical protein